MNRPCEYCGADLPLGVDRKTRRTRSHHFQFCGVRLAVAQEERDGLETSGVYNYVLNLTCGEWEIEAPDGGVICTVRTEDEAERLVQHLNRD